jgi:hypothetical protein
VDKLIADGVLVPKMDDVESYLARHSDLEGLVEAICKKARAEFGVSAELALQVYEDPEIDDRYLTLYVRQETYAHDIIDRIEVVSGEFHRQLESASGYVLVTTDFRNPGGVHAV